MLAAADAAQPTLIVLGLGDPDGHRPGTTAMRVMPEDGAGAGGSAGASYSTLE